MDITYFELNNWFSGRDYPDVEPFLSWMRNDLNIKFMDENWVIENELCVVAELIDMSLNFCITAKTEWVKQNCPELLTKYQEFLRYPDEDGSVYGRFDTECLLWDKENFGVTWINK